MSTDERWFRIEAEPERREGVGSRGGLLPEETWTQAQRDAGSTWVYKRLNDFHAAIEGLIALLKRVFGLDRCTWRGAESFAGYVEASVLTATLLVLARHLLA